MSVQQTDRHPVVACVEALRSSLSATPTQAWQGLAPAEVRRLVAELGRIESQIAAHKIVAARVLESSGAAREAGATSTGDLLAKDFGGDRRRGDRLVYQAEQLEQTSHTEQALAAGDVTVEQADVIAQGLAKLPDTATAEQRDLAERSLLKDAPRLKLPDLRRRTDRLTDVYADKKTVDAHENDLLKTHERRAREKTYFKIWDQKDGTHRFEGVVPELEGVIFKTALDAMTSPRQDHSDATRVATPDEYSDRARRAGLAFCDLLRHLPEDQLPNNGGVSALVTVNLDLESLRDGITAATLSDGTRVSADQARRIACGAGIIPQVLDGKSQVLDQGTSMRYFTKAQRIALARIDGGCTFAGCDRPPGWCEAHHLQPVSQDGPTDLANGALLCTRHHHHVHDHHWEHRRQPNGQIAWRPPGGAWQTNTHWRP